MVGANEFKSVKQGRQFMDTKPIEPTVLNGVRIDIKVSDALVKEGGLFSSNYITYTINTYPQCWEVKRKDADFYTLRKMLGK